MTKRRIRLFHRIDLRVALVVTAALSAFVWSRPRVDWLVGKVLGIDSEDIYIREESNVTGEFQVDLEVCSEACCIDGHVTENEDATSALLAEQHEEGKPYAEADLTYEEAEAMFDKLVYWSDLTSYVLSVIFAMAIGLLVSRMVTHRLTALTDWLEIRGKSETLVPMPKVRGRDEVATLAYAIQDSYEQNQRLVEELETRNSERAEWVAQITHDLRTPLAALMMGLDNGAALANQKEGGELYSKYFKNARLDSSRVLALSEDMLATIQLDTGFPLTLESLSPGEVAQTAVRSLESLCAENGLTLKLSVDADLPSIEGDGRLLIRCIQNLLDNAYRFANRTINVEVSLSDNQERVIFRVGDDGQGVGSAPKRTIGSGFNHGIGLQLVNKVLEHHDSELKQSRSANRTWFAFSVQSELVENEPEENELGDNEPGGNESGVNESPGGEPA